MSDDVKKVKRWDPSDVTSMWWSMNPGMLERDHGRYVLATDYADLQSENERLRKKVEKLESDSIRATSILSNVEMLDSEVFERSVEDYEESCRIHQRTEEPTNET